MSRGDASPDPKGFDAASTRWALRQVDARLCSRSKEELASCDRMDATNDTVAFNENFLELWKERDYIDPFGVGLTFSDLMPASGITPSLFDEGQDRTQFNKAVDQLNRKFGKNTIYLAGMDGAKETAEERIAFGKTELLSEGKDDNLWTDG